MQVLDAFILSYFTKFSHWFQRLTGRTNFFLAKFSLAAATFFWVNSMLWFAGLLKTHPKDLVYLGTIACGIYNFLHLGFIMLLAMAISFGERETQDYSLGYRNSAELSLAQGRQSGVSSLLFMTVIVLLFRIFDKSSILPKTFLLSILTMITIVITEYFYAVTPLPPGKSKIREFIESFSGGFRKMQPIRVPNR